jgi:acetoin utilization deacetylase AcuC-like enzyme
MEAAFIYSEGLWSRGFGEGHSLRPERLKRTYDLLAAYRAFDVPGSYLVEPRPATREELLLFHTAEYVDAVERLSAPGDEGAGAASPFPSPDALLDTVRCASCGGRVYPTEQNGPSC